MLCRKQLVMYDLDTSSSESIVCCRLQCKAWKELDWELGQLCWSLSSFTIPVLSCGIAYCLWRVFNNGGSDSVIKPSWLWHCIYPSRFGVGTLRKSIPKKHPLSSFLYSRHHSWLVWILYLNHTFISRNTNYGNLMTLCPFTAFLRTPFSNSDFLHYLLRHVFEEQESRISRMPLQHINKKNRLRYEGKTTICRIHYHCNLVIINYSHGALNVSATQEEWKTCWLPYFTWM